MDNKFLTKDKVAVIINNAPKGSSPQDIVNGLVSRGYKLEGLNDQPQTDTNNATFKSTGNEGLITGTAKAIANLPSSLYNLGSNIATAVEHPIDTVSNLAGMVKGEVGKVYQNTILKDKPVPTEAQQAQDTSFFGNIKNIFGYSQEDMQKADALNGFLKSRYGTLDNFKKTVIEDPAGVLADIATVFSGGGAAVNTVGEVSKVGELAKVGEALSSVANKIEPINATTKGISATGKVIKNSTVGQIASDIIPSISDLQKNQVVKALDLTQGDLTNIGKKTGNDVTQFIVSNNLLKDTPEAIADALNTTRKDTMAQVRSEVSKVKNMYTPEQIPGVIKGLDTILSGVDNVAGLENVANEIKNLKAKTNFTLEDIQKAKELIDNNSNIYSKIGDVKSGATAKGLDNIRSGIKTFIEDEVSKATQGNTDIKQLNNNVQTSYAIEDAINNRATRSLTRQKLSLGDSVVLFGGGATFNPAVGVGLYLGKKVIESPSFRLAFTKALEAKPIAKVTKMLNEIKNKTVSPETQAFIKETAKDAKKYLPVVESVSNITNKTKEEKKK